MGRNEEKILKLSLDIVNINIERYECYENRKNRTFPGFVTLDKLKSDSDINNTLEIKLKSKLKEVAEEININSNDVYYTFIEYLYEKYSMLFPITIDEMIRVKRELILKLFEYA